LRLYPPAALLSRFNENETTMCGYKIPAKTFILVSQFTTQRYSKHFTDPEKFNPDRFLAKNEEHMFVK
jgi:cytochrome P450